MIIIELICVAIICLAVVICVAIVCSTIRKDIDASANMKSCSELIKQIRKQNDDIYNAIVKSNRKDE